MAGCHDMQMGEIYVCEGCGLELKVVAECRNSHKSSEECSCHDQHDEHDECSICCCGKPMVKK